MFVSLYPYSLLRLWREFCGNYEQLADGPSESNAWTVLPQDGFWVEGFGSVEILDTVQVQRDAFQKLYFSTG